jgi:uncharacterized protein involved in exopolysaccharide biosynthesis/Mrp family chromosome partitioning ATPase
VNSVGHQGIEAAELIGGPERREASDRLDLGLLRSILRRRLRLFFYTAIIIFDIFALLAIWLPPSYTATAVVVLNGNDTPVTPTSEKAKSDEPSSNSDVETEMAIVTSRDIASKVVDYLHLENDPDMRALLGGGVFASIGRPLGLVGPVPANLTAEQRARLREMVIAQMARNLTVTRVSTAYAFSVAYSDSNPIRATAIANATAHIYTEEQVARKKAENADAARLLGQRIEALRAQAQKDYEALQHYRIANDLLSTTGATLTEEEISAYNREVASARAQAAEDQARLNTALAQLRRGSRGDDVGEALSSPVIQSLRVKRAELSSRVAEYGGALGPKNPDLMDALRQLADVDVQIQGEINRVISNLDARAKVSGQRLASLNGSLYSARGTLAQNNAAMVQQDDLRRRADSSQALYESYLSRYKEALAATGAEKAGSRLVSDARIPSAQSFPNKPLFLILGAMLGVGAGLAVALIAELSYTGLTSGEDVKQRLGLPYLGGIPLLKSLGVKKGTDALTEIRRSPRGPFAQAVRGVLTRIRQSGQPNQIIMVTSALPNEGKTTLASCLAHIAAQSGERVLLIDCDTVRHQLSGKLGVGGDKGAGKGPGLEQVLAGEVTIGAAIRPIGETGVSLLPISGQRNDKPLEMARMQALLGQLREHFAFILIDSAPVLPMVETRDLAALVDRTILAGQWRRTSEKAMIAAFELLPPSAQVTTGVVLSMVDIKKQSRFAEGDAGAFYSSYRGYYHA